MHKLHTTLKETMTNLSAQLTRLSRRQWLLMGGGLVVACALTVTILGYVPRTVALNYVGDTCATTVTWLPGVQRAVDSTQYQVEFVDVVTIGSIDVLSRQTCFIPQQAPEAGEVRVATAPWGGWVGRQVYTIASQAPPGVSQAAFAQAIATTRPLTVDLEAPDTLHTYQMTIGQEAAPCQAAEEARLECDIAPLQLVQGAEYAYELRRQFGSTTAQTVAEGDITTLRAIELTSQSIKSGQVVYDKPQEFTFVTDKPVADVQATLKKDDETVPLEVTLDDKTITLSIDDELERQADYTLTLQSIEATDGATLVEPAVIDFRTSDGPLVSGISIGSARVGLGEGVIIIFDQPIADQDFAKFVTVSGVPASVARQSSTQLRVQLAASERCKPFIITVAQGLKSRHGVESTQAWSHTSRTICHTTSVYGTSVQGRALVAYHFGSSGPVTMYVGAIHGNESSSMGILQSWINELEANPSRIGNRQIVIIPNINPDGIAAGTRANAHKVNLNRNFPTSNWVSDIKDTDGSHKGGGGSSPLSEPEAKALADITSRYRPRLLVSYHAIGSLVVGDPGGYSAGKAAQYAGMVGYRNATGMSSTFDYDITGAYEDWTYRNLGIPSMIVELGSYSYHNFAHHRAAFWAMLD